MNTVENTETVTDTVASTEVVAPKTTKTKTLKAKSPNGSSGKAGRKATNVSIPSGDFTMKDVEYLNPNIKRSTIRAHVNRNVKTGTYKMTGETVKTGGRGKPAYKFTVIA